MEWTGYKTNPQTLSLDPPDMRVGPLDEATDEGHLAMAACCVHKCLDDARVPRYDEKGERYSLWGRVLRFKEMK